MVEYNLISSRFKYHSQRSKPVIKVRSTSKKLINEVKSKLEGGQFQLIKNPCPCGAEENDWIISEVERYGLPLLSVLCKNCGTVRMDPYLDGKSEADFYANFYHEMYAFDMDFNKYFQKQAVYGNVVYDIEKSFLNSDSKIMEIGCGAGGALKQFQDRGYKTIGCDYRNNLIEQGKSSGVSNIYFGSIEHLSDKLEINSVDLIFLYHVFEHLADPLSFLNQCKRYLSKKGHILIIVPDLSKVSQYINPCGDILKFLHIAHKFNFSFNGFKKLGFRAEFTPSLIPINLCPSMRSQIPTLWVRMSHADIRNNYSLNRNSGEDHGDMMMKYLKRTEKLFSLKIIKFIWIKFRFFQAYSLLLRIFSKQNKEHSF